MPKHCKREPEYPLDLRGDREKFCEYCRQYLNHFIEIYGDQLIYVHDCEGEELTMAGFKGNSSLRFNRPESVDSWVRWHIEEEEETAPSITYAEFLNGGAID